MTLWHGHSSQFDNEMEMEQLRGEEHEQEPKDLEVGVHIKNLTKIYDKVSELMWRWRLEQRGKVPLVRVGQEGHHTGQIMETGNNLK